MEESPKSDAQLWRFVLERAVHELNNRVGGILSVSETHLSHTIDDSEIRQSLELIRDGAQAASDFVVAIIDLLAAEEGAADLIRLSELRDYLRTRLALFLPRHIQLITPPYTSDVVVRANTKLLFFKFLALVEKQLVEQPLPSFSVELALNVEGSTGWLTYRSSGQSGALQAICKSLFSRMKPALIGFNVQEKPPEFQVAIGFAAVKAR
jgi:hypothetical protein